LSRALRVAGLLLALGTCVACEGKKPQGATAEAGPQGPRTVRLDTGTIQRLGIKVEPAGAAAPSRAIHVPGTLDYNLDRYAEIGVPLEGRVTRVDVRVGDRVKKGALLATVVVPTVAAAQAEYLTAQAAAQAARKNRDREEDLLSRQLTTAREAEVARSEAAQAEAALAAAEARLRALRVGIPGSETAVAAAGTMNLTSPIDGMVVGRKANLGAFLTPDEQAFIVADLSELWALLDVYEADLGYLHVGAEVDLVVDALPGKTYKGTLQLIEPQLGRSTRAARARVMVPNADGALRAGLFVRASIKLPADMPGALLVPAAAVQPLGEQDVVFVEREPGRFEIRPVRVARRTVDVIEVAEGLSAGERIAVEGAFLLRGEAAKQ
jgi:cobalt-zinc-cadmium efflux system membrane fusion protein